MTWYWNTALIIVLQPAIEMESRCSQNSKCGIGNTVLEHCNPVAWQSVNKRDDGAMTWYWNTALIIIVLQPAIEIYYSLQ
jgi:hypothetical protein